MQAAGEKGLTRLLFFKSLLGVCEGLGVAGLGGGSEFYDHDPEPGEGKRKLGSLTRFIDRKLLLG